MNSRMRSEEDYRLHVLLQNAAWFGGGILQEFLQFNFWYVGLPCSLSCFFTLVWPRLLYNPARKRLLFTSTKASPLNVDDTILSWVGTDPNLLRPTDNIIRLSPEKVYPRNWNIQRRSEMGISCINLKSSSPYPIQSEEENLVGGAMYLAGGDLEWMRRSRSTWERNLNDERLLEEQECPPRGQPGI